MEKYVITLGDFLKNAGIVGFHYMLETAGAEKEVDFGYTDDNQAMWVSMDYAQNADWTDMYFKAFIRYFGPFSTYQGIKDKIQSCLEKIENENWNSGKQEKEDLKFINDKLLSNSYQAGFANIQKRIENPEIYEKLKKNKLSDKLTSEELKTRLKELQEFINQPECSETFAMKSIIYTYINRFWNGKCFLLRPNAKKDMREVFEKDFSEPFRKYLNTDHKKVKDLCIDCGNPTGPKEKVSIAFMNEVGDDFTRKRSAFWDCKVDAFLCPGCAFIYALSPLGFRLYANKFVFVNTNDSINTLLYTNSKIGRIDKEGEKTENKKYIEERKSKGHFDFPSAGSVFRINRGFGAPSGKIIDECGLRGKQIGMAQIAPFHGNFIINLGGATQKDVKALVEFTVKEVKAKTGFCLQPEIIFVDK